MRLATATSMSSMSARLLGLAVLGTVLALASPARAQNPAECQGMFQASDLNGDGVLSGAEIAASEHIDDDLASALGNQGSVTLPEFMAACTG